MRSGRPSRVVLVCALFLCATAVVAASKTEPVYEGKITIGTAIWPGYLGLYVAQEKGYFKEAGLDVEVKLGIGLAELSQDYTAGKMQGRANIVFDAVKESKKGFDHKVVLVIDYSNGSDAILASSSVASVRDFRGKRVAYEFGTLEEFFLAWVLAENAMELSDVVPFDANPEEAARLLREGQVDAAVTYEPFVSKALSQGSIHVVYSSADSPGLITDILTFRTDFIEAHPETIKAILKAYFRAIEFWKTDPAGAEAILAKYFNDTPENIAQQLKGVRILDRRENNTAFTFSTGMGSLYGNMRQAARFIQKGEGGGRPVNTDKLIERRFIKETESGH